jgi:hypothetical protein
MWLSAGFQASGSVVPIEPLGGFELRVISDPASHPWGQSTGSALTLGPVTLLYQTTGLATLQRPLVFLNKERWGQHLIAA